MTPVPVDVSAQLAAAAALLRGVGQWLPALGSDDLAGLAAATADVVAAARGAQAAVVLEAQSRGVIASSDNPRVADWVAASHEDAGVPVHTATGRSLALLTRVADRHGLAPLVQAVTTGAVTVEAASHVAGAFARLQRQVELRDWDLVMTGLIGWAAEGAIMRDLAEFEESMLARFGTDTEFDDRERRHDRRDFSLFRRNWRTGMYEAQLQLDPASEAVFSTALHALPPPRPATGPMAPASRTCARSGPGARTRCWPWPPTPPAPTKTPPAPAPKHASSSPWP